MLCAAKQAMNVAWDADTLCDKLERPVLPTVWVHLRMQQQELEYYPGPFIVVSGPPVPREEILAPRWLVFFGLICIIGVVIAVAWAGLHFK